MVFRFKILFDGNLTWWTVLTLNKQASTTGRCLLCASLLANETTYTSQAVLQKTLKLIQKVLKGLFISARKSQTAGRSCEKGYRSWDAQFFKTHVTPKGWDVKGGIPQNACWRLGCGEACKRWNTIGPSQKTTAVQGRTREMQWNCPFIACAQRSVAAWKRKD